MAYRLHEREHNDNYGDLYIYEPTPSTIALITQVEPVLVV